MAEFAVNNKIYSVSKMSLLITNYGKKNENKSRYQKKEKSRKDNKICRKYKKCIEGSRAVLRKAQEEIKQQANKRKREAKE